MIWESQDIPSHKYRSPGPGLQPRDSTVSSQQLRQSGALVQPSGVPAQIFFMLFWFAFWVYFYFMWFDSFTCTYVLHVCLCTTNMPGACRGRKRLWIPWNVVICLMGAEIQTWVLEVRFLEQPVRLTAKPPPHPSAQILTGSIQGFQLLAKFSSFPLWDWTPLFLLAADWPQATASLAMHFPSSKGARVRFLETWSWAWLSHHHRHVK